MKKTLAHTLACFLGVSLLAACSAGQTIADSSGERPAETSPAETEVQASVEIASPSGSDLLISFFKPVADLPRGTAGAMLKQAQAACDVLRFANDSTVRSSNPDELRANLAEAWDGLTDEERAAFEENLPALRDMIAGSAADWEEYRGIFEDAGIAEDMLALASDETAMESFSALFDHTAAVCFEEGN